MGFGLRCRNDKINTPAQRENSPGIEDDFMNKAAFVVLLGSMFVCMLGMNIISPLLPQYAITMGASSLQIGLVQAAFSISGVGTLLFVGRLSDRFGRKPFLGGGLVVLAVSSAALIFAKAPIHLILLRFVQGFGASTYLSISQAYMGDTIRVGNEGKSMGFFNAILFAGMGAGPLIGGVITDAFGVSTAFLVLAALNSLGLVAVLIFLREMPRKAAAREHTSFTAPLKSRVMRGVFSYRAAIGLCTATLMAFVPLFAGLRMGLSASLIGLMLAARIPISFCQSYTGRLADRWNRRSMVIWGGVVCIAAVSLIPLTRGFWTLLVAYLAVTVGQALGVPAANAYVVDEGRIYGMGVSVTMFMMAMYVGNSAGPVLLGGIADSLGLESTFYAAAICMAAGVALFAWQSVDSRQKD
jgi:MFS transporter, DHA1 family, multidrug resistance protein